MNPQNARQSVQFLCRSIIIGTAVLCALELLMPGFVIYFFPLDWSIVASVGCVIVLAII